MSLSPARHLQWEAETRAELKLLLETRARIEPRIRELQAILKAHFSREGE